MKQQGIDLSGAKKTAVGAAQKAGDILLEYFKSGKYTARKKGPLDIVTDADEKSDETIRNVIRASYPTIPVLTEETAPAEYSHFEKHEYLWIVDPLDGTANFSRGDENFTVAIALAFRKQPVLGIVYAPTSNALYWASKNEDGAYLNGKRIRVSRTKNLADTVLCTGWSHSPDVRQEMVMFLTKVCTRVAQIKILGSAANDLMRLANGKADAYQHTHLKPWDAAAPVAIIRQAGATVTDSDGGPWNVFNPKILAANPSVHARLLQLMTRH